MSGGGVVGHHLNKCCSVRLLGEVGCRLAPKNVASDLTGIMQRKLCSAQSRENRGDETRQDFVAQKVLESVVMSSARV